MQETQEMRVRSQGQENPLEEEMATHSSDLAWRIPRTEELAGCSSWARKESDRTKHAPISKSSLTYKQGAQGSGPD